MPVSDYFSPFITVRMCAIRLNKQKMVEIITHMLHLSSGHDDDEYTKFYTLQKGKIG